MKTFLEEACDGRSRSMLTITGGDVSGSVIIMTDGMNGIRVPRETAIRFAVWANRVTGENEFELHRALRQVHFSARDYERLLEAHILMGNQCFSYSEEL
jgi:hypothetical protein